MYLYICPGLHRSLSRQRRHSGITWPAVRRISLQALNDNMRIYSRRKHGRRSVHVDQCFPPCHQASLLPYLAACKRAPGTIAPQAVYSSSAVCPLREQGLFKPTTVPRPGSTAANIRWRYQAVPESAVRRMSRSCSTPCHSFGQAGALCIRQAAWQPGRGFVHQRGPPNILLGSAGPSRTLLL